MLPRRWLATLVFLATVSASHWAVAAPSGLGAEANEGCLCHTPDSTTNVVLSGLPDAYEANTGYELVLTVMSSIEAEENASQGGFRLLISNGTLVVNDSSIQELDNGWTHTEAGSHQRSWALTWFSPDDNTSRTDFTVHGNAVNGNNAQTGDAWNTLEVVVPGVAFEGELNPSKGIDGLSTADTAVLSFVLLLLVALLWATGRK